MKTMSTMHSVVITPGKRLPKKQKLSRLQQSIYDSYIGNTVEWIVVSVSYVIPVIDDPLSKAIDEAAKLFGLLHIPIHVIGNVIHAKGRKIIFVLEVPKIYDQDVERVGPFMYLEEQWV